MNRNGVALSQVFRFLLLRLAWMQMRLLQIGLHRLILLLGIVVYTVIFTSLAFDFHAGMRTHRSDLGQIDQAVWNSSRGRFLENTDNGYVATRMTDHVEPMLVLISPLFWIWDDVRALLLLQVLVVACGAWPLYELALRRLKWLPGRQLMRSLALVLALTYLLAPQLQSALLTEFHAVPLAVPFILWALLAIETRRPLQFTLAALLLATVKEETALLAAGLGAWAVWRLVLAGFRDAGVQKAFSAAKGSFPSPYLLAALAIILLSLAWFAIATFVIVPAHAASVYGVAQSGYFARYGALGDSPSDIFKSFFTQPGLVWQIATAPARLDYLRGLLAPFGFFSLLAPEVVLLSLPLLLANLLSAYPAQYYGEFHYSAPLVPYFAAGAAYGLARALRAAGRWSPPGAGRERIRTAIQPVAACMLALWLAGSAVTTYGVAGRGPLGGRYDPTPINDHHRLLPHFVAQIPPGAAVTATAAVHPHVSHRRYVYQFPLGLDAPEPAEWALLDVTTNTDMAPGDLKTRVMEMLAGEWGVVDAADGFLLLRKGAAAKEIPPAFATFATVRQQAPPGTPRQGWSFSVAEDWARWRQTRLAATLWNAPQAFEPATELPRFLIAMPDGQTIEPLAETTPPALVWLPLTAPRAGEPWRIKTLPLYLPRVWALVMSAPPVAAENKDGIQSADASLAVVDIAYRDASHRLHLLSWDLLKNGDLGSFAHQAVAPSGGAGEAQLQTQTAQFLWEENRITVTAWLPLAAFPGQPLDLWLQWQTPPGASGVPQWPEPLTPFVHLRQAGANRSQDDGPPRFFLHYDVDRWLQSHAAAPDWRVLPVPVGAPIGETWQVVIGLYDQQTGQRAAVLDEDGNVAGNEFMAGEVMITPPPIPDQTCALIPATCASQVK